MTAQVRDALILNGRNLSLACEIDIPKHERIQESSEEEMDGSNLLIFSTACWRMYIAHWEISNEKLYLNNIEGKYKLVGEEPLFADWYSGKLKIPIGKMIEYHHMGYASKHERDLFIEIEHGIVVNQQEIKN